MPEPSPEQVPEPGPVDVPEPGPVDVPEPAPVEVPEPAPAEVPEGAPEDSAAAMQTTAADEAPPAEPQVVTEEFPAEKLPVLDDVEVMPNGVAEEPAPEDGQQKSVEPQ